jgi:hypothetical protein
MLSPLQSGEIIWYKKKYGVMEAMMPSDIIKTAHTVYFLYSPIYGATRLNIFCLLRWLAFANLFCILKAVQ